MNDDGDIVTDTTDLSLPMEIGVTPPKAAQNEAGIVKGWYPTWAGASHVYDYFL